MEHITTEAWVLYAGPAHDHLSSGAMAELKREAYTFQGLTEYEVLAEPLYGCWEGNMTHALERRPVDICRLRHEDKVVIGNAGVVRIVKIGPSVTNVQVGDVCLVFCNGVWDDFGYPEKILAYDAPNTMGILAKQVKLHERQVIRIPDDTQYSYAQWAAFSLRYITAWANWELAYGCWRLQMTAADCPVPHVWGWGGGVSFAELTLAQRLGCHTAMLSADDARLQLLNDMGIQPIDRRQFIHLAFDEPRYHADLSYRQAYQEAEKTFMDMVQTHTSGDGVDIFLDHLGAPVFRATLKALNRQGVIATAGWKIGMHTYYLRALECINRHIHVHTHYARYTQGLAAVHFAERTGWLPPVGSSVYDWEEIPQLAEDYAKGTIHTYFPIFQINPL